MNRNKQIRAKKSAQEIEIKHKLDEFVTVGGRRLRKGYTTGTCAAAASKAATTMLVLGKIIQEIDIDTPAGISLKLPVSDISLNSRFVECSIVKDGGDDPDITSGLKIYSRVELTEDGQISVNAGEGIGRVTLPGLKVEVGKPAINPVPMQMIHDAVRTVLPHGKGAVVTLWVPGWPIPVPPDYAKKVGKEIIEKIYSYPRPFEELYDIVNDPHELNNLAENEDYKEIKNGLWIKLEKILTKDNDPVLNITDYLSYLKGLVSRRWIKEGDGFKLNL
jgi:hypothetical protein